MNITNKLFFCLSLSLSICLSVSLYIYIYIYVYIYIYIYIYIHSDRQFLSSLFVVSSYSEDILSIYLSNFSVFVFLFFLFLLPSIFIISWYFILHLFSWYMPIYFLSFLLSLSFSFSLSLSLSLSLLSLRFLLSLSLSLSLSLFLSFALVFILHTCALMIDLLQFVLPPSIIDKHPTMRKPLKENSLLTNRQKLTDTYAFYWFSFGFFSFYFYFVYFFLSFFLPFLLFSNLLSFWHLHLFTWYPCGWVSVQEHTSACLFVRASVRERARACVCVCKKLLNVPLACMYMWERIVYVRLKVSTWEFCYIIERFLCVYIQIVCVLTKPMLH